MRGYDYFDYLEVVNHEAWVFESRASGSLVREAVKIDTGKWCIPVVEVARKFAQSGPELERPKRSLWLYTVGLGDVTHTLHHEGSAAIHTTQAKLGTWSAEIDDLHAQGIRLSEEMSQRAIRARDMLDAAAADAWHRLMAGVGVHLPAQTCEKIDLPAAAAPVVQSGWSRTARDAVQVPDRRPGGQRKWKDKTEADRMARDRRKIEKSIVAMTFSAHEGDRELLRALAAASRASDTARLARIARTLGLLCSGPQSG